MWKPLYLDHSDNLSFLPQHSPQSSAIPLYKGVPTGWVLAQHYPQHYTNTTPNTTPKHYTQKESVGLWVIWMCPFSLCFTMKKQSVMWKNATISSTLERLLNLRDLFPSLGNFYALTRPQFFHSHRSIKTALMHRWERCEISVQTGSAWGSVGGSVGVVLGQHPPRRSAFVQRVCWRLGGVLPYFNEITCRCQRPVISLPTTLRIVRSANAPPLSSVIALKITHFICTSPPETGKSNKIPSEMSLETPNGYLIVYVGNE